MAVLNAVLVADFSPEGFVQATDFCYLWDVITSEQALEMLHEQGKTKLVRLQELEALDNHTPCSTGL
ncbi:hypothetical protein N7540_006276 [Penicillium herquei]|nr:hypothetical protein N7540_006276 [Penicillium herquei]